MILPNKIEPIEPNYDEIDAIILLERWSDEWSKDEDWWSGGNTWDLNVFTEHEEEDYVGSEWVVAIYGLEQHSTSEYPSTDTSTEIDVFELKL